MPGEIGNYAIQGEIGHGASSTVVLAKSQTGLVAIKCISKKNIPVSSWVRDRSWGTVPREVAILSKLDHPGIIGFIEKMEDDMVLSLFYQVCLHCHRTSRQSCDQQRIAS